jgi:organic hydroperoxide reductase OsmC/OhrA
MASTASNPLIECGKPLFFRAAETSLGPTAPPPRLGESVRVWVRSLSSMQKEALVVAARTGLLWRLASDEGAYLAGLDEAPCPLSFLTVGMVSSTMNEIRALAGRRGVVIDAIRLVQDNYYTMVGSALKGTMTGGARDVDLTAQIKSNATPAVLRELVVDAVAAAPISGLLGAALPSLFTLTHNGREIEPAAARPLGVAPEPDPIDRFDQVRPAAGDWSALIRRGGPTPKAAHTLTLANDSLADEQSRLLHIRGICTLDGDGIKHVEQQLFNPHGSIFRFLCDEAPENGGLGRAPDAATYISAGIAFCFMTQFGRYAQIARKDLRRYRIAQDTHFSLGRAAGGTRDTGRTDPVETHVYLDSGEDDAFARRILDMAEQTCFLHALCKAQLRTRVTIDDDFPTSAPPGVAPPRA